MIYLLILLGVVNLYGFYFHLSRCLRVGEISFFDVIGFVLLLFFGYVYVFLELGLLIYKSTNINFVIWRRK